MGGFETVETAVVGGDTDRTATVRAQSERDKAGGYRVRRTA
jgi:hypothetical protein